MATGIPFPEANDILRAPEGAAPGTVYDLHIHRYRDMAGNPQIISKWQFRPEELALVVAAGGAFWFHAWGLTHPPVAVEGENPFVTAGQGDAPAAERHAVIRDALTSCLEVLNLAAGDGLVYSAADQTWDAGDAFLALCSAIAFDHDATPRQLADGVVDCVEASSLEPEEHPSAQDYRNRAERAEAECAELRAKVAELEADKARLDYLDRRNAALNAAYGTTYRWKLIQSHNVNRLMIGDFDVDLHDSQPHGLPSCRDAIDERMREARQARS